MKYMNLLALCLSLMCAYTIHADNAYAYLTSNAKAELAKQNANVYVVCYDVTGAAFQSFWQDKTKSTIGAYSDNDMSQIEVFINGQKLENRTVSIFDERTKRATVDWSITRGFFFN